MKEQPLLEVARTDGGGLKITLHDGGFDDMSPIAWGIVLDDIIKNVLVAARKDGNISTDKGEKRCRGTIISTLVAEALNPTDVARPMGALSLVQEDNDSDELSEGPLYLLDGDNNHRDDGEPEEPLDLVFTHRCTLCHALVTAAGAAKKPCCPACGTYCAPMHLADDKRVWLNLLELRVLLQWAHDAVDGEAPASLAEKVLGSIHAHIEAQLDDISLLDGTVLDDVSLIEGPSVRAHWGDGNAVFPHVVDGE